MRDDQSPSKRGKNMDGFFSVDLGAFRCAAVGGLNSAVAHLVMARGSSRDNCTTQWSVNSIEQRTGISRPNANKAVNDLLQRGIWKRTRLGKHPIYESVSGDKIPGGPFTLEEREGLDEIRSRSVLSAASMSTARMLIARGLANELPQDGSRRSFELDEVAIRALVEPKAVWLPNALIEGAANETAPLELIRQTRNLFALRLMIELYAIQFLPHFGGAPHDLLKVTFERVKVGEQGSFVVWGFRPTSAVVGWDVAKHFMLGLKLEHPDGRLLDLGWREVWRSLEQLTQLGIIEKVGMLLDGRNADAEIIHPYAVLGGEAAERVLADAARKAAQTMVTQGQHNWADDEGYARYMVPVQKHVTGATMVEIFRLKYRPHTTATATWYATMQQEAADYLSRYLAISEGRAAIPKAASG